MKAIVSLDEMKKTINLRHKLRDFMNELVKEFGLQGKKFTISNHVNNNIHNLYSRDCNNKSFRILNNDDYDELLKKAKSDDVQIEITLNESTIETKKRKSVNFINDTIDTPNGYQALDIEEKNTMLTIIREEESKIITGINPNPSSPFLKDQNPPEEEKTKNCIKCKAKQPIRKNCTLCHGTGKLNSYICDYINDLLKEKEDTDKKYQNDINELKKKDHSNRNEDLQKNNLKCCHTVSLCIPDKIRDDLRDNDNINCTECNSTINSGATRYKCKICSNVCICEKCENDFNHEHDLTRIRSQESNNYFEAKLCPSEFSEKYEKSEEVVELIVTAWNNGKRKWKPNTVLKSKDCKDFKEIPVGDLSPGCKRDLLLIFKVPKKLKNQYSFQLYEGEHYFGNSSTLKINKPISPKTTLSKISLI